MTKEEAISYLQQLYPNGGHCWLDEQRIEAIGMAIKALQEEPASEKKCMFTKDSYTDEERKVLCEDCKERCEYNKKEPVSEKDKLRALSDGKQHQPISDNLEEELDKYIQDNFTIEKDQLDKFGIEEKDYMYSMDKGDMLAMVRYFTNICKVSTNDNLEEPVSEKDKLRALSDGKQHLGWLDDANSLEEPINKELDRFIMEHGPMATLEKCAAHFAEWGKKHSNLSVSDDLEEAVNAYIGYAPEVDESSSVYGKRQAFKAGANWQKDRIDEILFRTVLPRFMHGGEAEEVVAMLDEEINHKED